MANRIEPREHVIDAALANGDREAWKQALGFPTTPRTVTPKCPACYAVAEQWWSYCAMCGHHIAAG